jgi:hypothetical protein
MEYLLNNKILLFDLFLDSYYFSITDGLKKYTENAL